MKIYIKSYTYEPIPSSDSVFLLLVQEQFSEVLDAMFEVLVQPQDHVIDQGDDGDNFYVIERCVYFYKMLYK